MLRIPEISGEPIRGTTFAHLGRMSMPSSAGIWITRLLALSALGACAAPEGSDSEVVAGDEQALTAKLTAPLGCLEMSVPIDDPRSPGDYDPAMVKKGFRFVHWGKRKGAGGTCEVTARQYSATAATNLPQCKVSSALWCRQETQQDLSDARCEEAPGYFVLGGAAYDPDVDCVMPYRMTWTYPYDAKNAGSRSAAFAACEAGRQGCTLFHSEVASTPPGGTPNGGPLPGAACVKLARPDLYNAALAQSRNPTQEESQVTCDCVAHNFSGKPEWNDDDQCSIVDASTNAVAGKPQGFKWGVWNRWCVSTGRIREEIGADGRSSWKDAAGRTCAINGR